MSDIRAFIEARLAEREALLCDLAAQLANGGDNMRGGWNLWGDFGLIVDRLTQPLDLLKDVAVKRAILAEHTVSETSEFEGKVETLTWCPACNEGECRTVLLLAHPFRAHPDFAPAWKIEP